jgi:BASS family bile acid:Na+ symporter
MATNLSLVVLFIGYFVAYSSEIIGVIGTGGIVAAIILVIVAAVAGFLMGGTSMDTKKVLALGTGQRNLAAAFAVATSNFATNPDVLVEIMVASLTMYTNRATTTTILIIIHIMKTAWKCGLARLQQNGYSIMG